MHDWKESYLLQGEFLTQILAYRAHKTLCLYIFICREDSLRNTEYACLMQSCIYILKNSKYVYYFKLYNFVLSRGLGTDCSWPSLAYSYIYIYIYIYMNTPKKAMNNRFPIPGTIQSCRVWSSKHIWNSLIYIYSFALDMHIQCFLMNLHDRWIYINIRFYGLCKQGFVWGIHLEVGTILFNHACPVIYRVKDSHKALFTYM